MKRSEQFISDFAQLMSRGPERFEQFVENLPPPKRENLISALDQLSRVVADSVAVQREPLADSKSASARAENAENDCAGAPKDASDIATSSETVVLNRKHASRPKSAGAFSYDDVQTPEIAAAPRVVEMLAKIKEKLTTSPMLKSRQTLSELAYELDVPLAKRDTMPRMAQKILTALADREPMEIEKALGIISQEAKRGTSEAFREYAAFIVGDRTND